MIVTRWQAPMVPDEKHIMMMLEGEGLQPYKEELPAHSHIPEHRHPFDEVRMVAKGELLLNISGNKLLLRSGDRIIIPANTKHSKNVQADKPCICICALRTF